MNKANQLAIAIGLAVATMATAHSQRAEVIH